MPEQSGPPERQRRGRAYVPRWAYLPLSGEGAARFGGRWNPPGAPTIYAALELSTAWAEYNQGFVQHPALIARLELYGAKLVDLTDELIVEGLGIDMSIHHCEWRDMLDRSEIPPSYALRKALLAQGFHGVIYPSFMSPGGRCAAIWRWNGEGGPTLRIIDPDGRMPKSPASWV